MSTGTKEVWGRLVIFRHGQTAYNKNHLMTGREDVPLTDLGRRQAGEAGRCLAGISFDKVYSSTLSRAFNTAVLALEASGEKNAHLRAADGAGWMIEQREDLVEIDVGRFAGRNHKTDPEILSWVRAFDKPLPGGESDAEATARVRAFFEKDVLPRLLRGETVLVVCHAGIVRVFDYVLGLSSPPNQGVVMSEPRKSIPNAVPVAFDFCNGRLVSETALAPLPANENSAPSLKKPAPPRR